jgi:hypothetical protein
MMARTTCDTEQVSRLVSTAGGKLLMFVQNAKRSLSGPDRKLATAVTTPTKSPLMILILTSLYLLVVVS